MKRKPVYTTVGYILGVITCLAILGSDNLTTTITIIVVSLITMTIAFIQEGKDHDD